MYCARQILEVGWIVSGFRGTSRRNWRNDFIICRVSFQFSTSWTCFGVGWKNQVFSAYGSLDLFPLARCLEENGIGIWIIEKQVSILFPSHRSVRKWIKRIGLFIIHSLLCQGMDLDFYSFIQMQSRMDSLDGSSSTIFRSSFFNAHSRQYFGIPETLSS